MMENKMPNEFMSPEKQLELCNAINAATATGKIVTIDIVAATRNIQIAGAFPNDIGVILVASLDWHYRDCVPILWFNNSWTILARFPASADAEVIYTPDSTS